MERNVKINDTLEGFLTIPDGATGIVLFAHGSGSARHAPRNQMVAELFNAGGLATLLFDLLTPEEEVEDLKAGEIRFDISLLSERVVGAIDWIKGLDETAHLNKGLIGSSTGAAAALIAASKRDISAVVSRGGRPDLAGAALQRVTAPTLMIVGSKDFQVIELNKEAQATMNVEAHLELVSGATHLFAEPGTLEYAAELARDWFLRYL